MSLKTPSGRVTSRSQLVDAALNSYLTWRAESGTVTESYRKWIDASRAARQGAFEAYLAALDREEQAASAYQHILAQAPTA